MTFDKQKNIYLKNSYDIVGDAVREFWMKEGYAQDMIAFFYQKYDWEDETKWDWQEELVDCSGCGFDSTIIFQDDFCEGQTCVKDLTVVPLDEVTSFYSKKHNLGPVAQ